ncbi:hypothetical protein FAZ69_09730 [Trinickia terrae]|uniref:Uncharacterized protein n=1 Tax=Trinickia terrae TaxID=2571161 RepID=A0A4U1I758_9BURK|nr:hypothetical protein [Trinickia terrae]TKC89234.1 hypothetical protein FAZ69_09730 [Trinickia terrae]
MDEATRRRAANDARNGFGRMVVVIIEIERRDSRGFSIACRLLQAETPARFLPLADKACDW